MASNKKKATAGSGAAMPASAFVTAAKAAALVPKVGKVAVENRYRPLIGAKHPGTKFTGSVDLDAAFAATEPAANRWDYGVGIHRMGRNELALWIEPHSGGSTGEVKTVLAKVDWLEKKLALSTFAKLKELTDEARHQGIKPYIWLSSGTVSIRPGSREANMLTARGMDLPRSYVEV